MGRKVGFILMLLVTIICMGIWLIMPRITDAHCDTFGGPVIMDAQKALEKGDITSVLKWVKKESEDEIRALFKKTLAVRTKDTEAKDFADNYFFETVVRLHRAGEGTPYTGLKPAGTDLGQVVVGADKALETGEIDVLVKLVPDDVAAGIRKHFQHVMEKKKHANESVEAGREYVEAYVEYVHYVERIHLDTTSKVVHHSEGERVAEEHHK